MGLSQEDDSTLRRFLVGALDEDEERAVGERMLTDDEYVERASELGTELIDDYLEGNLSPEDRYRFETYFLVSPNHKRRLTSTQALKRYAQRMRPGTSVVSMKRSRLSVLLRRYWKVADAVAARLAIFARSLFVSKRG